MKLLTKRELAETLGIRSTRLIDQWMRGKKVPYIRAGHRSVFFQLDKVLAALAHFEVKAVGQK